MELEAVKYIGRIRSTDDTVVVIIGECGKTSFKASDLNLLEYTIWNKKNDAFKILVQRFGVDLFGGS